MIRVLLYDHAGTGLIFPAETGVTYANQVCGHACAQYEMEGFFVPYRNEVSSKNELWSLENELMEHFAHGMGVFDPADADVVDEMMRNARWNVIVDRDRIRESVEAWVHVIVNDSADQSLVSGIGPGPHRAVLTWCNSD